MRVAIQSYNTCFQNKSGGVKTRIKQYYEAMKKCNIDISFFNPFEDDIKDYDVLHIFRMDTENLDLIRHAKSVGTKVVISPIINTIGGKKIDIYRLVINRLPIPTNYRVYFRVLSLADLIIAETNREKEFIISHYKISSKKIVVIPNGANWSDYRGKEIFDLIGTKNDYVLQVGRFDRNKNQLNTIKALRETGIDIVFIGGPDYSSQEYFAKCEFAAEGYNNIHILGWIDSNSLVIQSAYSNAKVLILPSYFETFGMVAIEGAAAGANLAISNKLPILEYETFSRAFTFSPNNLEEIREKTILAYNAPRNENQKYAVRKEFSWDTVAEDHYKCFKKLIE